MLKKIGKIVLFFIFCISQAYAEDEVKLSLEPKEGTVYDDFVLEVKLEGELNQKYGKPELEGHGSFLVVSRQSSTQMQLAFGKQTTSTTYSFVLRADPNLKPGSYPLPILRFKNSANYTPPNLSIKIVQAQKSNQANRKIDVIQNVNNLEPYLGEQILYSANIAINTRVANGNLEDTQLDHFWKESFGKSEQKTRTINNGQTKLFTINQALFPISSGEIEIPARRFTADIYYKSQVPQKKQYGLFDEIFGLNTSFDNYRTKREGFIAEAVKLKVKPLPEAPANQQKSIPVGKIKVYTKLEKQALEEGDSTTLQIKLQGDANLRAFKLPNAEGKDSDKFTFYPDKAKLETKVVDNRIVFTKTFSIALVPTESGQLELPQYKILAFDPDKGQYQWHKTLNKFISVKANSKNNSLVVAGLDREEVKDIKEPEKEPKDKFEVFSKDLLPQHIGEARLKDIKPMPKARIWIVAILIPLLATFIFYLERLKAIRRENPRFVARQNAYKNAERKHQSGLLKTPEDYSNLLKEYLGDRFYLEGASLTTSEVSKVISEHSSSTELAEKTEATFRELDYLSFSKASEEEIKIKKDKIAKNLLVLLKELEQIKLKKSTLKTFANILLISCLSTVQLAEAESKIDNYLKLADKDYNNASYNSSINYYSEALNRGLDNPHIYYNIANAYFRIGKIGDAILHYRKALRELPRDPDLRANLELARAEVKNKLEFENSMSNLFSRTLILNKFLSKSELQNFWMITFILFWVTFAFIPRFKSPSYKYLVLLSLLLATYSSYASFAVSEDRLGEPKLSFSAKSKPAVIIVENTEVYSGDSENFQVIAILAQGSELLVSEERKGWLQIILPEDKKGWVKKKQIEII